MLEKIKSFFMKTNEKEPIVLHRYAVQAYDDEHNTTETEATFPNKEEALAYMRQEHFRAKMDTARGNGTLWIEDNSTTYYIEDVTLTFDNHCLQKSIHLIGLETKGLDVTEGD